MTGRPARSRAVVVAAVVVAALAGWTAGCAGPPATEVALDVAGAWPTAMLAREPVRIDIGTPGARVHLGEGWYYDETNRATGESFAWSRGGSSELRFHLGWRRDLEIEIRARPFQYPGAPTQTVALELNGTPIGAPISLPPGVGAVAVRLPAHAQLIGRNRLVARYGRVDSPAATVDGAGDQRRLAVAWSEIVFTGTDPSAMASSGNEVTMPAGARADLFVELAAGSELRIDGCSPLGPSAATIELTVETDDGPPASDGMACTGPGAVFNLGRREGLTRLRLEARPVDPDAAPSGVVVTGARILSPPGTESRSAAGTGTPAREGAAAQGARPNVIVYLVDALRADRLGVYGCDRPLSPRLDAMASEGVTFTDTTAQSSWTKAAVASIFTGLWPRAHGVNGPDDRLPEDLATLPERLRAAGYRTGAVVANAYVGRPFGFARGFDTFEFIEHTRGRSEVLHERVAAWLRERAPDDPPFFLYVHAIDPHAPYDPPEAFRERFAAAVADPSAGRVENVRGLVLGTVEPTAELERDLRDLYDAEVAANDSSFGRLLDELDTLGELDDTVVIFTSDHGEAFGEHGSWTHGLDLYNEVLAVPLVIRLPGGVGGGRRVAAPVQHIDLMPTILALCGLAPVVPPQPGAVLLDLDGRLRVGADRTIYAYLDYWGRTGAVALRDGWKLIEPLSTELGTRTELYRHDLDPGETRDLAAELPVRRDWLLARLAVALESVGVSQTTEVDAETRAQLEALGYVH